MQVHHTSELDLLAATFIFDEQSAPEFKSVEFFSTGKGHTITEQNIPDVRADHGVHMLREPWNVNGDAINLIIADQDLIGERDGIVLDEFAPSAIRGRLSSSQYGGAMANSDRSHVRY